MEKIMQYIINSFKKLNNELYLSYNDEIVLNLLQYLDIKNDFISTQKVNIDNFAFHVLIDEIKEDVDVLLFFYIGSKSDKGYLSFYIPSLIANKINLMMISNLISNIQFEFKQDDIINALIIDIKSKSNCLKKQINVAKTNHCIYFYY